MATIAELIEAKQLHRIGGNLGDDEQPERLLYAFPHVIQWLDVTLPELEADFHEGKQDPIEQADDLFYGFVSGEDFAHYHKSHSMMPDAYDVWELKTPDLRFFGWFFSKGVFIISEIDTAFRCKQYGLYLGYKGSTRRRRDQLNLDEPKFIAGEYEDVL